MKVTLMKRWWSEISFEVVLLIISVSFCAGYTKTADEEFNDDIFLDV